jgi:hypothetical protein
MKVTRCPVIERHRHRQCRQCSRRSLRVVAFGLFGLISACGTGEFSATEPPPNVETPGSSSSVDANPTPPAPTPPNRAHTVTRLRRLGNTEIENVVSDLTGGLRGITRGFLDDPHPQGYDNDANALTVDEVKLEEFALVAQRVAEYLTRKERLDNFAPCAAAAVGPAQTVCARTFVTGFARKAWGRPPTPLEVERLAQLFDSGAEGNDYPSGISLTIEAILLSPHFIYQSELGDPATASGDDITLSGAETASALSFLLTASRPDPALLDAGLGGALATPEGRVLHARRLLATPPGRLQLARFVRAWLELSDVAEINKDLAVFPGFNPEVRRALDRELSTFLDHVFSQAAGQPEGKQLEQLFFADYTFPAPALAPIYDKDLLEPIGMHTRVRLDPKRRRGLLSSPAFFARHALVGQTNPVDRGLLIRSRLFCQDVPGPPPGLNPVAPTGPIAATTRGKYEVHVSNDSCRACHRLMDALGFGLEQFDAIGRYRTHEGTAIIDPRGVIEATDVDGPFVGPVELSERLLKSAVFRNCMVQQLFRFAVGRAISPSSDQAEIDYLAYQLEQHQRSLTELFVELVARPNFTLRRQEAP